MDLKRMILKENDLHFVFSRSQRALAGWNMAHAEVFRAEARNATVNDGLGHFGHCPPGEYKLGTPIRKDEVPFGPWFIPVLDYGENEEMREHGRGGIGIHGGGSGLSHPFAGLQGWQITEGCIRLQNIQLCRLVLFVQSRQAKGGTLYLTVTD